MHRKNLDQLITMGIVIVSVVWTLLPYHTPAVGTILALPLVFGLPGYTLTQALTHKRPLESSHTLVFSLGLSLVIDLLGGFILNLFPIGLQAPSWVMFLGSLTVVLSLLTVYLRHGAHVDAYSQSLSLRLTIRECILFGLAIVVVILSILNSVQGVIQQPHQDFTQLWLLPSNQSNKSCAVRLGIHNFKVTPVDYFVVMTINETNVTTKLSIALAPGQQWEQIIPIVLKTVNDIHVKARLYQSDEPKTAYRTVTLTLSVHDLKESNGGNVHQCEAS